MQGSIPATSTNYTNTSTKIGYANLVKKRNDNRLENLELWTKPHPTGVRVEDAVAWAQEILERYVDYKLR